MAYSETGYGDNGFGKTGKTKAWVDALRLRTLPLAISGALLAGGIAAYEGVFNLFVCIYEIILCLALQILANFADEYGDLSSGVDNNNRLGPIRGLQRGDISKPEMKTALIGLCCFVLIWMLLFVPRILALSSLNIFIVLFIIGICCIGAAVLYTVGPKPYGYIGLGDVVSFVFFGLVAVIGGAYLYNFTISPLSIVAGLALGFPTIAVINLNNMRDADNDKKAHKLTVANVLGIPKVLVYHAIVTIAGITCFVLTLIGAHEEMWKLVLCLPSSIIWIRCLMRVITWKEDPHLYDKLMQPTAFATVLMSLLCALALGI